MWDNSDEDYFEGLLDGWLFFDNNNSPMGFLFAIVLLIAIVLILYYT